VAILKIGVGILGAAALLASCVGETPPNPIPAPDLARITVFFPLDGLVNGRGSPGPVPEGYKFVYVKPHPSRNVDSFAAVNPDGSFSFRIASTGNDVLELAFTKEDNPLAVRGAPTFVEVPLQPAARESFYCCHRPQMRLGKCQPTTELMCTVAIVAPDCASDGDCAFLSGDHVQIDKDDFTITPPDATGRVTVTSNDVGLALNLIRFENRGQRGIGGPDPQFRNYVIADEQGVATTSFKAKGDDEIVVRAFQLNGYVRSREHAMYVPDSPLVGLDVVGLFPFEGLQKGKRGRVGIRFAPFGLDQRGMCPPSQDRSVALCFSGGHEGENTQGVNLTFNGGLDHEMIEFPSFTIGDRQLVTKPQKPNEAEGNIKFTDGDVLAAPVSMVLIIDDSEKADELTGTSTADGGGARFEAARNFLRSARSRDRVAVIATGARTTGIRNSGQVSVRLDLGTKDQAVAAIDALDPETPNGENDLNGAMLEAGKILTKAGLSTNGRIVVISASQPAASGGSADEALKAVTEDLETGRSAYPVYIVARRIDLNVMDGRRIFNELDTYAGFTDGLFVEVTDSSEFVTRVAEVTGRVSGAFVLVYDIDIPIEAGSKIADVRMTVQLTLPDTTPNAPTANKMVTTMFEGLLELRDNPPPP